MRTKCMANSTRAYRYSSQGKILRLHCARDVGAEKDIGTSQNDEKSKRIHLIISYSGKR